MRRAAAHLALALVGLAAVLWAVTLAATPTLMCRDVVLQPGDTCPNADGTQVQTYEQRLATWQAARPVVAGVGLLVAGFGAVLLAQDAKASRSGGVGARSVQ